MHELGISRNIVAIVAEAARDRRVRGVLLEVGKLSGVMVDAIAFCFDAAARGTPVEGATLQIREIDGRALCQDCGAQFGVASLLARCACGSQRLKLLAGEELNVKSMELEEVA